MSDLRKTVEALREPDAIEAHLTAIGARLSEAGNPKAWAYLGRATSHRLERLRHAAEAVVAELEAEAERDNNMTRWRAYTRAAGLLKFALGLGEHPDDA